MASRLVIRKAWRMRMNDKLSSMFRLDILVLLIKYSKHAKHLSKQNKKLRIEKLQLKQEIADLEYEIEKLNYEIDDIHRYNDYDDYDIGYN